VPEGDALLDGADAKLDPEHGQIWFNASLNSEISVYYRAHEYAHHWLHGTRFNCSAESILAGGGGDLALGINQLQAYSPDERQEREANVFARELLLPREQLRLWHIDEGLSATEIAAKVGILVDLVHHQLLDSILIGDVTQVTTSLAVSSPSPAPDLDPSQVEAAEWDKGPLLVEAGPGTGKTSTLVGRIRYLLDSGTDPKSIVALTYSNKAAAEIRERVARSQPHDAHHLWLGTLHSFGLELLRRYGKPIGLPASPIVLDPIGSLALLEGILPALRLQHYENIYDPSLNLRDILQAISRAKDELATPEHYRNLAKEQFQQAGSVSEKETAEKALEVADVYASYQNKLTADGALDFGDLIMRAVLLLREHENVRADVQRLYPHVLVDEFQDVNHASAELVAELAGDGKGLWIVGDVRQAIYRFRGAAPRNTQQFMTRYSDAHLRSLRVNYRSRPTIVDTVATLATGMRASRGRAFTPWEVHRNESPGEVKFALASDEHAETAGIAREIEQRRLAGLSYREQAVLCRSHTTLSRTAAALEEAGVPVLYLGNLFEREEIRDLLALLELTCMGRGRGLLRVAAFPEYQIPQSDVELLLQAARESNQVFPRALDLAASTPGLSDSGRVGIAKLGRHISGIPYAANAWRFLVEYLFEHSKHLGPLLNDDTVAGRQKRLAIFQLVAFAHGVRRRTRTKREFLGHIRRLEIYGEERQLRSVPEWASGIDAVRLLTVHASKGLQFEAVYLPKLGKGHFPAKKRPNPCPLPHGLAPDLPQQHEEEEECLFFVGLSRARESLILSRALRYGKRGSNPSPLIDAIRSHLPRAADARPTWVEHGSGQAVAVLSTRPGQSLPNEHDVRNLDVYIMCPRQYYYEQVLELPRGRADSAYVTFHRVVYRVFGWVSQERRDGRPVSREAGFRQLDKVWKELGPTSHVYADLYFRHARAMVALVVERAGSGRVPCESMEWSVPLPNGTVRITPDLVKRGSGRSLPTITRLRTGAPTRTQSSKDLYAILDLAAAKAFPGGHRLEILYLSTGTVEAVQLSDTKIRTRLKRYEDAMAGIQRGEFPPSPTSRRCPRCPHYFVCAVGV
tara:strand:+ start:5166 stop:8420 length:3255 start_codon:yes stop_codon:yes gene_type:complete